MTDEKNIIQSIEKAKSTKLQKYDNENYNNPEKIKQTYQEKRESGYWFEVYPEKDLQVLAPTKKSY
jgi:hypothetical protein